MDRVNDFENFIDDCIEIVNKYTSTYQISKLIHRHRVRYLSQFEFCIVLGNFFTIFKEYQQSCFILMICIFFLMCRLIEKLEY